MKGDNDIIKSISQFAQRGGVRANFSADSAY